MVTPKTQATSSKSVDVDGLTREELFEILGGMCRKVSRRKGMKEEAMKLLAWTQKNSGDIGFGGVDGRVVIADSKGLKLVVIKTPADLSVECIADEARRALSNGKPLEVVDYRKCELRIVRTIPWPQDRLPGTISPGVEGDGEWWGINGIL